MSGIGYPASVGKVALTSLAVNVVANLVLIPPLGINGAALASAISYSVNGAMMIRLASRLAQVAPRTMVVPTIEDLSRVRTAGASLLARRSST